MTGACVAGLLVFLLAASPAAAKNHCPHHGRAPHGNSEASQYVESVPGPCGNQSIGQANGNGNSAAGSSAAGSGSGGSGGGGSAGGSVATGGSATGAGSLAGSSKGGSGNTVSASLRKLKSQGGWGATVAALTHATAPLGVLGLGGGGSSPTGGVAAHQVSDGSPLDAVGDISPGLLAVALAGGAGFLALGLIRRRQTQ
jgi:hypothetical protein